MARLPVNDDTYAVFEALLYLPYDTFRPIMDLLFDETIVPEDLVQPPEGRVAAVRAVLDAATAQRAHRNPYSNVTPQAVAARCTELLRGRRPSTLVLPRDASAASVGTNGAPASAGAYAPAVPLVASTDPSFVAPNPIEVARSGSVEVAAYDAADALAATLRPEVT